VIFRVERWKDLKDDRAMPVLDFHLVSLWACDLAKLRG
jgi:hypothetical protein